MLVVVSRNATFLTKFTSYLRKVRRKRNVKQFLWESTVRRSLSKIAMTSNRASKRFAVNVKKFLMRNVGMNHMRNAGTNHKKSVGMSHRRSAHRFHGKNARRNLTITVLTTPKSTARM